MSTHPQSRFFSPPPAEPPDTVVAAKDVQAMLDKHMDWIKAEVARHPAVPLERVDEFFHEFIADEILSPDQFWTCVRRSGLGLRSYLRRNIADHIEKYLPESTPHEQGGLMEQHAAPELTPEQIPGEIDPFWFRKMFDEAIRATRKDLCKRKLRPAWVAMKLRMEDAENPTPFGRIARQIGTSEKATRNLYITATRVLQRHTEAVLIKYTGESDFEATVAEFSEHARVLGIGSKEWGKW